MFGKLRRGNGARPGPPVYDDQVNRVFTAAGPQSGVADRHHRAPHRTGEGELYLCADKDVHSNRIVGYSISDRMTSRLAVTAIDNAAARRSAEGAQVAGCIVLSDTEYVRAGVPGRLDPHSDGRGRMLVPGGSRAS